MVSQVVNNKPSSSIASRQKYQAPGRPISQEDKLKCESQASESPKTPKPKSKLLKKLKVKQMVSLFNIKISQLIRSDGVVSRYNTLVNEMSPPPKPVPQATLPTTVPFPQTRYTIDNAPVPSPQMKSLDKVQKLTTKKLLEEAVTKLETVEIKQKEEVLLEDNQIKPKPLENEVSIDSTPKIPPRKKKCAPVVPQQQSTKPVVSSECSATSSAKHSEVESDSGISNSAKNTSDESEHENHGKSKVDAEKELNFTIPIKPMRKNKTSSILIWKGNSSFVQTKVVSTTNSELDCKDAKHTIIETVNKRQSLGRKPVTGDVQTEPSFVELDKSLVRVVKSSHNIELSLLQNTCDDPQKEDTQKDFSFAKPTKPMRKKKTRRTLNWRKDSSLVETNTLSTTDSESDCKKVKHTIKKTVSKAQALDLKQVTDGIQPEPSFVGLDVSLMRVVNSPRKIKSAYTLTVFTPPPHKGPSLNKRREAWLEKDMGKALASKMYEEKHKVEAHSLADTFDQVSETGSNETGSNEVDSPIRQTRKSDSRQSSIDPAGKIPEIQSNFSTPIKSRGRQNLISAFNGSGVPQQIFSPIAMPLKIRRSSVYDNDSRRTSIAMQVINEDHSLEHHDMHSPRKIDTTDVFFANAPTVDMTTQNTSSFWVKSGDFSIALDIYNNDPERVKLLYEIFSQTRCDTKDIHFGIDDHQFSVHSVDDEENVSKRLPQNKETSHYWFSTGDLTIPFSGKLLTSAKIQRLFKFIQASVEETGVLRFGVDEVEFSNVPEFWTQMPKLSMESNYSMLVGLQSGNSNGLEGRSTYAWPHSKPLSVSDLNQSDFESDDFEENESARFSLSFMDGNLFVMGSCSKEIKIPGNSETIAMTPESFCKAYDSEPLELLFEDKRYLPQNKRIISIKDRLFCLL